MNVFEITYNSVGIEGCTLTFGEVDALITKGTVPKDKTEQEVLMVLNHHQALIYVLQLAKNNIKINNKELQKIASIVMKDTGGKHNSALGTVDVSKGEFRLFNVFAGKKTFPNYSKVPQLVNDFLNSINDVNVVSPINSIEQYMFSFKVHYDFVSIHPFVDGNGRVARLIMNYFQAFFGLPILGVYKENKEYYYSALDSVRKTKSMELYFDFMFSQNY